MHVVVNQKQKKQILGIFKIKAFDSYVFMVEFHNQDAEFFENENEVYKVLDNMKMK